MSPDQQHCCTVQVTDDGAPYLALEPSSGERSSYSVALHPRPAAGRLDGRGPAARRSRREARASAKAAKKQPAGLDLNIADAEAL